MNKFEQKIINSAIKWWENISPCEYTREEHLKEPTINTCSLPECQLALVVSNYIEEKNKDNVMDNTLYVTSMDIFKIIEEDNICGEIVDVAKELLALRIELYYFCRDGNSKSAQFIANYLNEITKPEYHSECSNMKAIFT